MERLTEENISNKLLENNERAVFKNRTRMFLLPILGGMKSEWVSEVNKFYSVAVGLADCKYYPYLDEPSILLLKNVKSSKIKSFNKSADVIRDNPYFIKDYIFADAIDSWLHMFVIKLPNEYEKAYKYFLQSKYSMMYSEIQKKRFFTYNRTRPNWRTKKKVRDILDKNPSARTELELKLSVSISEQAELESKLNFEHEVFNYDKDLVISINQTKLEFQL